MCEYNKYNFNDSETVLNIIKRDKHSFIEGACVEHLFYKDVFMEKIRDNLTNPYYSTGWWRTKFKNNYNHIIFKVGINKPTDEDLYIASLFKDEEVYFFYIDESDNFMVSNISDNNNHNIMTLNEFMDLNDLTFYEDFKANEDCIDTCRQDAAIEFLNENGLTKEYSFQRFFVNFILGKNVDYLLNIDAIVLYYENNEPLVKVCEIKFKYESKSGFFGLNIGFVNLFKKILSYEIPISHYILYNGTKNNSNSIINVLSDDDKKSECFWICCNLDESLLDNEVNNAPSKTTFNGYISNQGFINISTTKFKKFPTSIFNYNEEAISSF